MEQKPFEKKHCEPLSRGRPQKPAPKQKVAKEKAPKKTTKPIQKHHPKKKGKKKMNIDLLAKRLEASENRQAELAKIATDQAEELGRIKEENKRCRAEIKALNDAQPANERVAAYLEEKDQRVAEEKARKEEYDKPENVAARAKAEKERRDAEEAEATATQERIKRIDAAVQAASAATERIVKASATPPAEAEKKQVP